MTSASSGHTDHVNLPDPNKLLIIEPLDYENPYDHKKMHRHDYFEMIFIKEGTGNQLIDFTQYDMAAGHLYVIYPGQIHLMNRNTTNGLVLQFRKDIFEYLHPVKHYNLHHSSALANCGPLLFDHLYDLAERINNLVDTGKSTSAIAKHKAYSYLQIILLSIIELNNSTVTTDKERNIVNQYLSLITTHIHTKKKVGEYAELLDCHADKLNQACKKGIGKAALELIHEELMLEIRRLLLLNEMSLKEITYHLNFDSQSNFTTFIRSQTGMTPKELQQAVMDIYN